MVLRSLDLLAGLLLAAALAVPDSASALESPWADMGKAKARLIAAGTSGADAPLRAGVEVRLSPGWHTYWRYPGDAGVPPRFDWAGSRNVATIELRYPAPERIAGEGGFESIGYQRDLVLPLSIRAADPAKPVALRLKLDIGVCEKICIPAEAKLALDIPPALSSKQAALDAAEQRVPTRTSAGRHDDLGVIVAKLERGKQPRALVDVAVPLGESFDLFAEGPVDGWALPLPERISAGGGRARFAVTIEGAPPGAGPIPNALRLTLVAGRKAVEVLAPLD